MVLICMQPFILLLMRTFWKDKNKIKSMISAYLKCHIFGGNKKMTKQKNKYHG
jgi:hypothetical protein